MSRKNGEGMGVRKMRDMPTESVGGMASERDMVAEDESGCSDRLV
jgi:hypothetical protein